MSIYTKPGVAGQIKTTTLPSGDMAVSAPVGGLLEQIIFNLCKFDGRRSTEFGGWIVPRSKAGKVAAALAHQCVVTAK